MSSATKIARFSFSWRVCLAFLAAVFLTNVAMYAQPPVEQEKKAVAEKKAKAEKKNHKEAAAPKEQAAKESKTEAAKPAETPAAAARPYTVKREPFKIQVDLDGVFEARNATELSVRPQEWLGLVRQGGRRAWREGQEGGCARPTRLGKDRPFDRRPARGNEARRNRAQAGGGVSSRYRKKRRRWTSKPASGHSGSPRKITSIIWRSAVRCNLKSSEMAAEIRSG